MTAFSALFLDVKGGGCGAGWEWDGLKTAAVVLLGFCILLMATILVAEHNLLYKERKSRIKAKTRRKKTSV